MNQLKSLSNNMSIGRWGRFDSTEMESAYQLAELRLDFERAKYVLVLVCLGAVLLLPFDYSIYGNSFQLRVSVVLRTSILALNAFILVALRRHLTPKRLEGWMIGLCVSLSLMVLFGYANRPLERMNHPLNILIILMFAVVLPMRFRLQMITSAAYALASGVILLARNPDPFVDTAFSMVAVLTFALGFFTARSFHRIRRERFAAHQSEVHVRMELESALVEIKTLRGLLPICSGCKRIRQNDGAWRNIEDYVSANTEAKFTHGICPSCRTRLYPEYSKGENPSSSS
jgi:hypothetical protein